MDRKSNFRICSACEHGLISSVREWIISLFKTIAWQRGALNSLGCRDAAGMGRKFKGFAPPANAPSSS